MNEQRGYMIVIYGVNNIGKSTQIDRLIPALKKFTPKVEHLKYPSYELEPTGPIINGYLRENNPLDLSSREVQLVYTLNRLHFESTLRQKLEGGIWIVAEDYTGTGLAWVENEHRPFLELMNSCLFKEDITILLDGDRFSSGIEWGHKHENDTKRIAQVRQNFLELAKKFDWSVVHANQTEEKVHLDIYEKIMHSIKAEIPPA